MSDISAFAELVKEVRTKKPLVHHITNYVTVNDCANVSLAIGASPIMADAIEEVAEITAISSSLVINIGTLNARTVESMIAAGKKANEIGIPVILDPVGAGASTFRNETTNKILEEIQVSVIRGNISEIKYIGGVSSNIKGVDAAEKDKENDSVELASNLAEKLNCVIAITGEVDTVSDGDRTILLSYGHKNMSEISGTGCMCTSLIGAFCGASPEIIFEAATAAIICMGISGEMACEEMIEENLGNGSIRNKIIDVVSQMSFDMMDNYASKK